MPPRKPLSSRASPVGARRGGRSADPNTAISGGPARVGPEAQRLDKTVIQPSPFPGPGAGYQPGSAPPTANEDDDIYGPADGGYTGDEDVYGEDDPFPDEEGAEDQDFEPRPHATGEVPRAPEVTRIAPIVDGEDEEEDGQSTRAGPPIHLEVISGPDQGKSRRFRGVRMVIGRTQSCDFKLSDSSVSRRHLELVLGDSGVLLRDLGSGNGTRVNGQRVDEKLLEDGDEIAIGKTCFRFVDELAPLRKKRLPEGRAAESTAEGADGNDAAPSEPESEGEPAQSNGASADGADSGSESSEAASSGKSARAARGADATNTQIPALSGRRRPVRSARRRLQALGPKQKQLLALAGIGSALMVVALIALAPKAPSPPPNPYADQAAARMQEARNALREQKFEQAVALIEQAEKLMPGIDVAHLGDGARKELAAQKGFEQVRALYKSGEFDKAREALEAIPVAIVLNEAERRKLAAELDAAENEYGRRKAQEALDARDAETAAAIIARLPRAMAQELTPKLEALRAQLAQEKAQEEREQKLRAAAAARRAREKRKAYIEEAFAGVARKFHQGEFLRASLECDRVVEAHRGDAEIRARADELKKWIPQFGRYLDEGQKKFRSGALEAAARPLRKARDLYQKIGFDGALGPIIDEQLAAASLSAGQASLQRNDLASAADYFREALRLNPGETRAQQGLDSVTRRAEDLYLDAYMIRDRDPRSAAAKFRIVLDVLPQGSPTWEKAKNQLAALGQ